MQIVEVVSDEVEVLEADGLISGELDVEQGDATNGGSGFMLKEPSEPLEEKCATSPPSWCANCRCFLHRQEQGRQDCAFQL
jgi:hypothetical protein